MKLVNDNPVVYGPPTGVLSLAEEGLLGILFVNQWRTLLRRQNENRSFSQFRKKPR